MIDYLLKENNKQNKNIYLSIFIQAFAFRLLLFLLVFLFWNEIDPFFVSDDKMYSSFISYYLKNASSLIDFKSFFDAKYSNGLFSDTYHVWLWLCAIVSYIFNNELAIRFVNIIFSSISVVLIYQLCRETGEKESVCIGASKLYAFMPYTAFSALFVIKDISLTTFVLLLLLLLAKIYNNKLINLSQFISVLALFFIIKSYRSGVAEVVLIPFIGIFIAKSFHEKNFFMASFMTFLVGLLLFLFGQSIFFVFEEKFLDNIFYNRSETIIAFFRIDDLVSVWKLPLCYMWSMIQPLIGRNIETNSWLFIITLLNLSSIPIMFMNVAYLIEKRKKKNWFYLNTLILHLASIVLTLGSFRHYLYIVPYIYINAIKYESQGLSLSKQIVIISGSSIVIVLIGFYHLV